MSDQPTPELPARDTCAHIWVEFDGQSGMRIWKCKHCDIRKLHNPRREEAEARVEAARAAKATEQPD